MREVLRAKGTITNPTPEISWAVQAINDFRYRDRFNLSYPDFLAEPMDQFVVNKFIMEEEARKQHDDAKKAERASRRRSMR